MVTANAVCLEMGASIRFQEGPSGEGEELGC